MNPRMINSGRMLARADSSFSLPPFPSIPTPPPLPFTTSSGGSDSSSQSSSSLTETSSSSTFTSDSPNSSSLTTGNPSFSFTTPLTHSTLTTPASSTGILSPSNGSNGSDVSSHHGKLSAGIIGMIVALTIFALVLALFCIRLWYIRRRKARRANANWTLDGKPNPSMVEKAIPAPRSQGAPSISIYSQSEGSRWSHHENDVPATARTDRRSSWFDSLYGSYDHRDAEPVPALPEITYTRPSLSLDVETATGESSTTPSKAILTPASDLSTPVFSVPRVTESGVPYVLATVQRPFIRKLPDELDTKTGQQLGVIRQFDDGWTLCVALNGTTTGPQGMVPTECLKRMSTGSSIAATPVAEPSRRFSSSKYANRKTRLFK